ncbi:hypothetical protein OA970_01095 [Alphaproteobacteria bacterium]|nr:hypothetical protein [Alphaproteobacteria bacterium]|tara:strand:+ start:168 stop:392 length:225 start_codon:yes stop_codon:yes gene_type:complete
MKNINTNILFSKSNLTPRDKLDSEVPQSIFRQELITWSHTKNGINKTTLVRNFSKDRHIDGFISEPIIFEKNLK